MAPKSRPHHTAPRVALVRGGIVVSERTIPLLAGSVRYSRMPPESSLAGLEALLSLGLKLVDTYIPWGVHEQLPGQFDFGERDPRLDVVKFLRLAEELGLYAIVRPGPHINAELTHFG